MSHIGRLLRTVSYLKPVQLRNRLSRRLFPVRPKIFAGTSLRPLPQQLWDGLSGSSTMLSPTDFFHLSLKGEVATAADWNNSKMPRLWIYHLHYFEDLVAKDSSSREAWHRSLISRWINENRPLHGSGWEPYPISRRLANWTKWILAGHAPTAGMVDSLAAQTEVLFHSLEWHLLGNHIFANAVALVFAGTVLSKDVGSRYLQRGLSILSEQLPSQILPDGGHFELSPMYHALILHDILDLIQLAKLYPEELASAVNAQQWPLVAGRMLDWLAVMTFPDGGMAGFNDNASGIAPTLAALRDQARRLGVAFRGGACQTTSWQKDSGYFRLQQGPWVVFLDAAAVGASYIPGHAHADTLSVEVAFDGERLICNSGTSTYDEGAQRDWERSTAAHSTVELDGLNSSEVWASFRVGGRAQPFAAELVKQVNGIEAAASHNGYRFVDKSLIHHRRLRVDTDVTITDCIKGSGQHTIVMRLPLAVGATGFVAENRAVVTTAGGSCFFFDTTAGCMTIENGTFASTFGASEHRFVITITSRQMLPANFTTRISCVDAHSSAHR
ncbi:MAG: Heparinase family protein [Tardiphaga sp.]|nr:Heparinase family protein [Tardiphaga sp.]